MPLGNSNTIPTRPWEGSPNSGTTKELKKHAIRAENS